MNRYRILFHSDHGIAFRERAVSSRYLRSPLFWLEFICFFLMATPFELQIGSGYVYLIKLCALFLLIISRLLSGNQGLDKRIFFVLALIALILVVNFSDASIRLIFVVLLMLLGAALGQLKQHHWKERLLALVTCYLFIHLFGFFLSASYFYLRGEILDFHAFIFPGSSRIGQVGQAARLSGFQLEPGTYAQWMLIMLVLRCMLMGRIISIFTGVVVASVLFTISLWAVVGVLIFLISAVLELILHGNFGQKLRMLLSALVLTAAVIAAVSLVPDVIVESGADYLESKAEMNSESGLNKKWALEEFRRSVGKILVLGEPLEPGLCPSCVAPQDVGAGLNSAYYFGVFPAILLFGYAFYEVLRKYGVPFVACVAIMLAWKAPFYDPALWMVIGVIFNHRIKNNVKLAT